MSADDPNKTVFRMPQPSGERTVMRPNPGKKVPPPAQAQARVQKPVMSNKLDHNATHFATAYGLNRLVNAASTLIAVFEKTRQSMSHPDVPGLHQSLVREIKHFESTAKQNGIRSEIILAARYILCTALDEAVLNTPWGSESAWTQRTLLSIFHNETFGGEKFFLILDRMRQTPAENSHMLELMYILLSLGFEGKYRIMHRGRDGLEQVRDELFRIIRNNRGEYERSLSPSWQGLGKLRNTLTQYIPMWVIASITGVLLLTFYSGFRYWLYHTSSPVVEKLNGISELDKQTIQKQIRLKSK